MNIILQFFQVGHITFGFFVDSFDGVGLNFFG